MEVTQQEAKHILTPQHSGFLAAGPYPFTHALSAYTGCGFGQTTCGLYCYAQFLPNWSFRGGSATWGHAVTVKSNAAELLERELHALTSERRRALRIFLSTTTDPYQPLEREHQVTRRCLEVFARYQDLDLLVIQTRSPLAERDLAYMQRIPYAWLSITIETDVQDYLKKLRGGPALAKRWALVRVANEAGVPTQVTVSPCLPYSDVAQFGQQLLSSGARRVIVDSCVDGDGAGGERTARSPFATVVPDWQQTDHAHQLYEYLCAHSASAGIPIGWSNPGFCGIPPRRQRECAVSSC
jgi:DNA repair photolyase